MKKKYYDKINCTLLKTLGVENITDYSKVKKIAEETNLSIVSFADVVPKYAERYDDLFYIFHPLSYVMPIIAVPFKLDGIVYGIANSNVSFGLEIASKYSPPNLSIVATIKSETEITDELLPYGEGLWAKNINGQNSFEKLSNSLPTNPQTIEHGKSHTENARKLIASLSGHRNSELTKAVAMATACLLVTSGAYTDKIEAYMAAIDIIESGSAIKKFEQYKEASKDYAPVVNKKIISEIEKKKAFEAFEIISKIKSDYDYKDIEVDCYIEQLDYNYLSSKFFCHYNLQKLHEVPREKRAIITGFGPTNSPTAGTLSVILKTIALQKETGYDTEIIISNLGAFLSRNVNWIDVLQITARFIEFIKLSGFDSSKGKVRTHIDKENLGISSFINEHALSTKDFNENKEATEALYEELNLLGSQLGIITDSTYTVADIIKPLFKKKFVNYAPHEKERVLVVAGIEEHYFPRLAQLAIERINSKFPDTLISENSGISAIFTKLISGLSPYPKMSKSIPDSAINIGDTNDIIRSKIMLCSEENEKVIYEMMTQASNWSFEQIIACQNAFKERLILKNKWEDMKEEYLYHFLEISDNWKKACEKHPDIRPD